MSNSSNRVRSPFVNTFPPKIPVLGYYFRLFVNASRQNLKRQALGSLFRPDVVAEGVVHVDKAAVTALGDLIDSRKVLITELDALEVGLNALGVGALGEHTVTTTQTPGNENLSKGVATLFGNSIEGLVLSDPLTSGGDLVLGTQRRVGLGHDVLGEAVLHQLVVGQEGVNLNLVDLGEDLGVLGHGLKLGDGPVGDTDSLGLAVGVELLHGAPCLLVVLGEVLEDNVLYEMR